jgi:flagellar motor protein MotB
LFVPRIWLLPALLLLAGCQQGGNPFLLGQGVHNNAAPGSLAANHPALATGSQESQVLNAKLSEAERRLAQLDAQNRELTAQIAQAQQVMQAEREQKKLIQQQLADAAAKYKDVVAAKDDVERRAKTLYTSQQLVGGPAITANSSIKSSLKVTSVNGVEVRQEGTTIRMDIPADKLFKPGTAELAPGGNVVLDEVAAAITKNYPRQLIVIEAHTDNSPALATGPGKSHQLAAGQAHLVLDYLVSQRNLPPGQLSEMSFGGHRPRYSNNSPEAQQKNRRIEIVIYPDTIDGKP